MDPRESHGETRRQLSSQTWITRFQSSTPTSFQQTLITFHQIQRILVPVLCCTSLRTMRQQGGMFHGPTALDWLCDRTNLNPQNSNPLHWHQTPSRRHVDQREFHTWWVEQSSSFIQWQPFQLHLLHQEFQLDTLLHNGEEDTRSKRRRKSCVQVATSSYDYVFLFYWDKFFRRIESDCIWKSGDADSFGETR